MINKLCCYKEIERDFSAPMQIHYIENVMQKTTKELSEIKSELRSVTIDSLVGDGDNDEINKMLKKYDFESIEEYQKEAETGGYEEDENPFSGVPSGAIPAFSGKYRMMSVKLKAQTLHPRKFVNIEDLEDELIDTIMLEAKKSTQDFYKKNLMSFDIKKDILPINDVLNVSISEKPDNVSSGHIKSEISYSTTFQRKILTKIIQISNLIATEGRIGPATSIMINPKMVLDPNIDKVSDLLRSISISDVVKSDKVEENRIYVFRNSDNETSNPIYVHYNKTLDEYYVGITSSIKNSCFTFEII